MAGLASINIKFQADLKQFSTEIQNSLREIDKFGQKMQSVGRGLTAAITLPIAGLGIASLKTFGDIQALQKGLISVMGNAELAAVEFEKLKEVAKLPGLGLEEAVRGSVNLQAAGFSADEARAALLSFGNALATVGKGKRELDLVTLALTQLNNKSGGFGQDLRQLTEQLPQLRGALTAAFGTADTDKISKSGVTGKQVVQSLIKEFEKLPKVTGGINNAFENLGDATKLSLAGIGEAINKAFNVEGILTSLGNSITKLAENFSGLSLESQRAILIVAGIAAAIGPVLFAIGALSSTIPIMASGLATLTGSFAKLQTFLVANPYVALAAAIALIGVGIYSYVQSTKEAVSGQTALNEAVKKGTESAANEVGALDKLYATATNVKVSTNERKKAVDELQALYPAYFKNLDDEAIKNGTAKTSYDDLRTAIFNKSRATAVDNELQKRADDRITKEIELREKIADTEAEIVKIKKGGAEIVLQEGNAQEKSARVVISKSEYLSAQNKLLKLQQSDLQNFNNKNLKDDQVLFSAKEDYLSKIGKLIENENEVTKAGATETAKATDKLIKSGTIAFFEAQITALQKLQKEQTTTNSEWIKYQNNIDAIQVKIDALTNTKINLPKPQIDLSAPEAPSAFGLQDLKAQKSYYEGIREQFSTTSAEYQTYAALINGTQLKINAIEGVDDAVGKIEEVKTSLQSFNESVSNAMAGAVASFAEGFGQVVANFANGGSLLQGVAGLFLSTLAGLMVQVGKIAIQTGIAILGIKKALQSLNPYVAIAAGVALIALGSIVTSKLGDAGAFANGGVVGGTSYSGDQLFARVNSGEMILNDKQQNNLSKMINPASGGAVSVVLGGGFEIDGTKLRLVLDRTDYKNSRIS